MSDESKSNPKITHDQVQDLATRFVDLANTMKNEGHATELVSGGLMFASCIYATYNAAGNEGHLHDTGVEKIAAVYRRNLAALQGQKRSRHPEGTP